MSTVTLAEEPSLDTFFQLWTIKELEDALKDHQRAPQARWPATAVVLSLWYWALTNRSMPFNRLLYQTWHLVVSFLKKRTLHSIQFLLLL